MSRAPRSRIPRPEYAPGLEPPPSRKRPKCPNCSALLKPIVLAGEQRRWEGNYVGYANTFCRLNCAAEYGLFALSKLKENRQVKTETNPDPPPNNATAALARDVVKQWPDIDQAFLVLYKQSQGLAAVQWSSARSAAAKMYLRACQVIGTPSSPQAAELAWPDERAGDERDAYFLHPDADPKTPSVQRWDVLADLRLYAQRSSYTSWVIRKGEGGEVVAASNG